MKLLRQSLSSIVGVGALLMATEAHAAASIVIKLGSATATGSPWHTQLKTAAAKVAQLSGGAVELRLFVGGTMGDEGDLVKKLRIGSIQAAAMTTVGAHEIAPEVLAVDLPLLYANNTERDYVLAKEQPALDKALLDKGFVALAWSDVGSVRFFSTSERPTLADMRASKLGVWSDDPVSSAAWTKTGFNPTAVSAADMVPSFASGLINATPMVPSTALTQRLHDKAKAMTSQPWSSLTGVLIVDKKIWEGVAADVRAKLEPVFRDLGKQATIGARKAETDALGTMKKQGLKTVTLTDPADWARMVEDGRDEVRGKVVPAATFDEVHQHIKDHRAGKR